MVIMQNYWGLFVLYHMQLRQLGVKQYTPILGCWQKILVKQTSFRNITRHLGVWMISYKAG